MSERREKKKCYNQRLEYIDAFNKWLDREPPILRRRKWKRWFAERPVLREVERDEAD